MIGIFVVNFWLHAESLGVHDFSILPDEVAAKGGKLWPRSMQACWATKFPSRGVGAQRTAPSLGTTGHPRRHTEFLTAPFESS